MDCGTAREAQSPPSSTGRRKELGTRWRKLPPGPSGGHRARRHDQRLADLTGGNDVSATATMRRWLLEVIELLAARAPRLDRALKKIARSGGEVVPIDGTLVRTTCFGIRQELFALRIVHQVARLIAVDAAAHAGVAPERISLTVTIRTARHTVITGTGCTPLRHRLPGYAARS
jgi:hypothetical protein